MTPDIDRRRIPPQKISELISRDILSDEAGKILPQEEKIGKTISPIWIMKIICLFVERMDSYAWIGKMAGLSADTVEFGMNSFPAIFNEIVAPVVLAIVLFL